MLIVQEVVCDGGVGEWKEQVEQAACANDCQINHKAKER